VTAPLGPWKAIVFDFDGTLAELNIDFAAMRRGVLALASGFGIPTGPIQSLHVLEMIEAAAAALGENRPGEVPGFLRDARTLVEGIEIAAAESGALFQQTRPLLAGLRERSVRTGIITRNCRSAVLTLFPDIGQYCQAFLSRDDVGRVKPHPDHLMAALALLGILAAMGSLFLKQRDERQQYDQTIATMTAIREAILGKPGLYCNGVRQFTGYVADMGGLPLLVDKDGNAFSNLVAEGRKTLIYTQPRGLWTRNINGGTSDATNIPDTACWKYYEKQRIWAGWRGPYLAPPADGVLRDGWGNRLLFSEGEIITLKYDTPFECDYSSYTTVFGQTLWRWTVNKDAVASAGTYRCKCDWAFPTGPGSSYNTIVPYPGFASPYYMPGNSNYPLGGLKWADCWEALPKDKDVTVPVAPIIEPQENSINRDIADPNTTENRSVFTNLFFGAGTLCVVSYGADGKPGGSGYDRDIEMCIYRSEWTGEVSGMVGNTSQNYADFVYVGFPKLEAGQGLVQWRNEIDVSRLPADSLGGKNFYFGTAPLRYGQTETTGQPGSRQSILVPMGIRSIQARWVGGTEESDRIYVFPVEPTGNFIGTVRAGQ
jgi:phosphoglycolate phosphatase